jgi:hypothetical protein
MIYSQLKTIVVVIVAGVVVAGVSLAAEQPGTAAKPGTIAGNAVDKTGAPTPTSPWVTKPDGQVDINPVGGAFDRLDQSGDLVITVQPPAGQSGYRPAPVELRLKIAAGREEIVRRAAAGLAKGAKVKVGCVWSTAKRERFVWELAAMESR